MRLLPKQNKKDEQFSLLIDGDLLMKKKVSSLQTKKDKSVLPDSVFRLKISDMIELTHTVNYSVLKLAQLLFKISENNDKKDIVKVMLYYRNGSSKYPALDATIEKSISEIYEIGEKLQNCTDAELHTMAMSSRFMSFLPEGLSRELKLNSTTRDMQTVLKSKLTAMFCGILAHSGKG